MWHRCQHSKWSCAAAPWLSLLPPSVTQLPFPPARLALERARIHPTILGAYIKIKTQQTTLAQPPFQKLLFFSLSERHIHPHPCQKCHQTSPVGAWCAPQTRHQRSSRAESSQEPCSTSPECPQDGAGGREWNARECSASCRVRSLAALPSHTQQGFSCPMMGKVWWRGYSSSSKIREGDARG